jgi:malonyl CoA-acyl carrier protein transacylase
MIAYLFPGQGSQQVGMGKDLFGSFPRELAAAQAVLGWSIEELCLRDSPPGALQNTAYTQPALFVVSALTYLKKLQETGRPPDFAAGHSLGEYSALFAAGVFDFQTGLQLVQRRGALMARVSGGAMAAVIGMPPDRIAAVLAAERLEGVDIANLNSPDQTVISLVKADLDRVQPALVRGGARAVIPLNVSGAFHSRYMADARREFEAFLQPYSFAEPRFPVVSNVEARPYRHGDAKRLLAGQITSPVRWSDTIHYLLAQPGIAFEEIGPGAVLTGLLKKFPRP